MVRERADDKEITRKSLLDDRPTLSAKGPLRLFFLETGVSDVRVKRRDGQVKACRTYYSALDWLGS